MTEGTTPGLWRRLWHGLRAHVTLHPAPEAAPTTYLEGVERRQQDEAQRRRIAFGLIVGWILYPIAIFQYHCVPSAPYGLWRAAMVVGLLLILLAVTYPRALALPERAWMGFAHVLGSIVLTVLMTLSYFLFFVPAGLLHRWRRGTHPFHAWEGTPPDLAGSWERLEPGTEPDAALGNEDAGRRRRSVAAIFFGVIALFVRRRHWFILPVLIMLIVLGLVLFFVQSSALAPFIYSLF